MGGLNEISNTPYLNPPAVAAPAGAPAGGVLHDKARVVVLLDDPRRREAARRGHGAMLSLGTGERRCQSYDGHACRINLPMLWMSAQEVHGDIDCLAEQHIIWKTN